MKRTVLILALLAFVFCCSAGYISVISYNDGGRVLRLWLFGATITLIDEPAALRQSEGE
jgi:hypothetical protein